MNWRCAIIKKHNGDLDAVRAEIESTEFRELRDRYYATDSTIRVWESKLKVHAMRVCKFCDKPTPSKEMAITTDGRVGMRCVLCEATGSTRGRDYRRKLATGKKQAATGKGGTIVEEIRALSPVILRSPRMPISGMQGNWNRYVEQL